MNRFLLCEFSMEYHWLNDLCSLDDSCSICVRWIFLDPTIGQSVTFAIESYCEHILGCPVARYSTDHLRIKPFGPSKPPHIAITLAIDSRSAPLFTFRQASMEVGANIQISTNIDDASVNIDGDRCENSRYRLTSKEMFDPPIISDPHALCPITRRDRSDGSSSNPPQIFLQPSNAPRMLLQCFSPPDPL